MGKIPISDLDDPVTTIRRNHFIKKKPFIRKIYTEWYQLINDQFLDGTQPVIELGSGPGFIKDIIPSIITSDVLFLPFVDAIIDGSQMPIMKNAIGSIVMADVFHHLPNAEDFFEEMVRILKPGGRLIKIEPWVSRWSKWIFTKFHHEMLDVDVKTWKFSSSGPLSGANLALPWIVFKRDRILFQKKFPGLHIHKIQPIMPITYLLGGGFSSGIYASLKKFCLTENKTACFV